jgi:patatin-like phospholipase/acyl hydrolase
MKLLLFSIFVPFIISSPYNILSFDGGGIRGIIPAVAVDYIENYSYTYANRTYLLQSQYSSNHKLPMSDLFDMVAGTSTGSILSSSLAVYNKDNRTNKYWA